MLKVQKSLDEFFPTTMVLLQNPYLIATGVTKSRCDSYSDIFLQRDMSGVCKLEVPLQINVSVGRTWGDVH